MSAPGLVHFELAYRRETAFALEVLDGVSFERVSRGLQVVAHGLRGKPIVNGSGLFVWLNEDRAALQRITIEPCVLPYHAVTLQPADLGPRLTRVVLAPRVDYAFPSGLTGLRGTLIESRVTPPDDATPVRDARVRLHWLDDAAATTWVAGRTASPTDARGHFAAVLRLGASDTPLVGANGTVRVHLRVRRPGLPERGTPAPFDLPQGRIADPSTFSTDKSALVFAWDELQP